MVDYAFMKQNTEDFMSLWRCPKPTIAKVHGHAVAGGSDIALCCDLLVMADDARIVLRIGINLGDIIVDGDDIHGDGVNIAARLEAEAPAGGIVIVVEAPWDERLA